MTDVSEVIHGFLLKHEYDPIKAHNYYLRTRQLKGRTKGITAREKQLLTADKKLTDVVRKTPVVMNPKRRIGAAEQKLIRTKSLVALVKDPKLKADLTKRIAAAEKKLSAVKGTSAPAKKIAPKKSTQSTQTKTSKPKRVEEDQVPLKSPTGAKLVNYNGHGAGRAVYSDGRVYDGNGWHDAANAPRFNVAQAQLDKAREQLATAPPEKKRALAKKVVMAQRKLNALKGGTKSRANQ